MSESPLAFPSDAPTPELADLFPTILPEPERLVFEYVAAAAAAGVTSGLPALSYYADRDRVPQPLIPVVRGWPAYPGKVPSIGVAAGPETEDQQHDSQEGGFAGSVTHVDPDTDLIVGGADYYAEALYGTVLVVLIHENRDERDRLHHELRRILFPMRRDLLLQDPQVKRVRVDSERTEESGGPPVAEAPFVIYMSIFTVHVYYEMLEPRDVVGPEAFPTQIDASVTVSDSGP